VSPRPTATPSPAAAARQRLADAEQAHADILAERSGYEAALAALLQRQDAGTALVDDDDTEVRLRTAIGRCARLVEAKDREVAAARRLLINEDDTLGTAVAPVIQMALGVPVTVVTTKLDTPTNLPVAYVVAVQPPTRNTIDGHISGTVELHWHRSALHVQPNAKAITDAADALGLAVEVVDATTRDEADHFVDVVKINVRRAYESLPVVAYCAGMDDTFRVRWFASALAAEIAESLSSQSSYTAPPQGVRLGSGNASAPRRRVETPVTSATTVADGCIGDGVRERVVQVAVTVAGTAGSEYVWDRMPRAINAQVGKVHAGLGRVESVQTGAFNPASSGLNGHWVGGHIEATFTFVSKVAPGSDEVPTVKPTAATATPVQEPTADRGPRHPGFFLR